MAALKLTPLTPQHAAEAELVPTRLINNHTLPPWSISWRRTSVSETSVRGGGGVERRVPQDGPCRCQSGKAERQKRGWQGSRCAHSPLSLDAGEVVAPWRSGVSPITTQPTRGAWPEARNEQCGPAAL